MNRTSKQYLIDNGLEFLFELVEKSKTGATPISIVPDDLARLHKIIRKRKSFTTMEFGVGFSTFVIANALHLNKQDWAALEEPPKIRNAQMFKHYSVDSNLHWIEHTKNIIPDHLAEYVTFHHSTCSIGTYQDQICHYYDNLPDVIADFIYLDGPDPKDVQGNIRGMSFQCPERTVMAADLLLMESTFLPGTFIIADGRTNNCRFLINHFKRKYAIHWDQKGDFTTFELVEERLGKYNILGSDVY